MIEKHRDVMPFKLESVNNNGKYNFDNFVGGFTHMNMTNFEIKRIFQYADGDNNGEVNESEWGLFYDMYI